MNSDKKKFYIISALFVCALLLVCFIPNDIASNIAFAAVCTAFAVLFFFKVKKRSILAVEKRQVVVLMAAIAIIVITAYYLTGLSFGFVKVLLSPRYLWKYVLPFTVVVISSELIRSVIIAQKNKITDIIFYFVFVALDAAVLYEAGEALKFGSFINLVSMIIIPSLTANLLYHPLSSKYGMIPPAIYRTVMLIYPYIIPIKPDMPAAMLLFFRPLVYILVFLLVYELYKKRGFTTSRRKTLVCVCSSVVLIALLTSFMALISCRFRFGLMLVGSESMENTICKGDGIIYEQYDGQIIKKDQVLVFEKGNTTYIHRVVDIETVDGVTKYYTKGDANEDVDSWFVIADEIVGVTVTTIKYIGYPTIWVRMLFNKS